MRHPVLASAAAFGAAVLVTTLTAGSVKAQSMGFTPAATIPGPVDLVRAEGTFAYLTRGMKLTIFDLSDPAAPVRRGEHAFPEEIWGFHVAGALAYVAAGHSGLWILDVSDPDTPRPRGSIATPGQAKNVAVSGGHAVVADHMSGVDIIDISDVDAPVEVGSVYTDGYARDVAMFGSRAYAVDHPAGFYVLDMTAPDPLEAVGSLQSASAPRHVEILDGAPHVAVLVGGVPFDPLRALRDDAPSVDPRGTLQIYDVSAPSAPTLITTFRTPGDAHRAELRDHLAYVADGPAGLSVVDLSTPEAPRVVGSYATPRTVRDVAVGDGIVLLIDGTIHRRSHTYEDGDVVVLSQVAQ
ncbi:MAG: hypothetical protein F4061_04600 [Acidobacteria bacterium]|nr:hypothetical protein [Acidobacteriota bacterium]